MITYCIYIYTYHIIHPYMMGGDDGRQLRTIFGIHLSREQKGMSQKKENEHIP